MAPTPPKLAPKPIGLLVVVVLKAQHLPDKHKFSKSDPYCVVQLADSEKKTTKWDKGGGQHPLWDEEFRFPVYDKEGEKQKLNLCVYAKESGEDDSLGEGEVPLEKWKDNEFDDWVPLTLEGKERGQVFLEMTYYPNVEETKPLNLTRRPSKLGLQDRLSRPLPTPPSGGALHRPGGTPHPRISSLAPPIEETEEQLSRRTSSIALDSPPTRPGQLPFPGDPEPPTLPAWLKPGHPTASGSGRESSGAGGAPGRAGWEGQQAGSPALPSPETSQWQQPHPAHDPQYDYGRRTSGGPPTAVERPLYSPAAQQYSPSLPPPQQYPASSIPPPQPQYPTSSQPYHGPAVHQQPSSSPFVPPTSPYQYPSQPAPLQSPPLAPSLHSPSYPSTSQHPDFKSISSPAPPPPTTFSAPPPQAYGPASSSAFAPPAAAQQAAHPGVPQKQPHYFPPVPPRPPSATPEMPGAYHVAQVETAPLRPPRTPSATYTAPPRPASPYTPPVQAAMAPPTPPLVEPSPPPPPKSFPSQIQSSRPTPTTTIAPPSPSSMAPPAPSRAPPPPPPPAPSPLRVASPPHQASPLPSPPAPSRSPAPTPSRAHLGQLALEQRIKQEREDARLAAQWAEEDGGIGEQEERKREELERADEEMARMLSEEDGGAEEEKRRREEEDERLARALAEREDP